MKWRVPDEEVDQLENCPRLRIEVRPSALEFGIWLTLTPHKFICEEP